MSFCSPSFSCPMLCYRFSVTENGLRNNSAASPFVKSMSRVTTATLDPEIVHHAMSQLRLHKDLSNDPACRSQRHGILSKLSR